MATGTTAPTYISATQRSAACADGEIIPVTRVGSDIIYEVDNRVSMSSVKAGSKVTLHTDALTLTTTTTGGVAEIVSMDGTAAGDTAYVRFTGAAASA
jgi:hypothetical protein